MKKLLFLVLLFSSALLNAQTFVNLNSGFLTMGSGSAAVADYDNDGDPDFALQGFSGVVAEFTAVYENVNDSFIAVTDTFHFASSGSLDWADMDNDGDPDLLQCGQTAALGETNIYRNDGNNQFTLLNPVTNFLGVAKWYRMNNDNLPDLVMGGLIMPSFQNAAQVWQNLGNGNFVPVPTNLPQDLNFVDFTPQDLDGDGDDDLFITGSGINVISAVLINQGFGQFTTGQTLLPLYTGEGKWGDLDGDSDIDLVYNGIDFSASFSHSLIYINQGGNNFVMLPDTFPGTGEPGTVDLGDVDHDGDLDILLSGTYLLRNEGNLVFTNVPMPDVPYAYPARFIDFDGDLDLDLLCVQSFPGNNASTIYENVSVPLVVPSLAEAATLKIFPNPAHQLVQIEMNTGEPGMLSINNLSGKTVWSEAVLPNQQSISINLEHFLPGIYFYSFRSPVSNSSGKMIVY